MDSVIYRDEGPSVDITGLDLQKLIVDPVGHLFCRKKIRKKWTPSALVALGSAIFEGCSAGGGAGAVVENRNLYAQTKQIRLGRYLLKRNCA